MISISIFANMPPLLKQDLDKADSALEIEEMAKIYSLSGNRFGISIENLKIGKPTKAAIKNPGSSPNDPIIFNILLCSAILLYGSEKVVIVEIINIVSMATGVSPIYLSKSLKNI